MKKILFLIFLTSSCYYLKAQQNLCVGDAANASRQYSVDLADGPSGTPTSEYNWTISSGFTGSFTGNTTNKITVNWGSTPAGTYTITVTEKTNGCFGDPKTLTVVLNALPTVTVDSPSACIGAPIVITATPGVAGNYTYTWTVPAGATNPGDVASFTPTVSGTYSVIITNNTTGCSSNPASGVVTIFPKPVTSSIGF